ncbi:MAG: hypothetical protein N2167_02875 [Flavobacteriales bacterium]|nr:hypothetical protein [Flavobacteriales bacterium]
MKRMLLLAILILLVLPFFSQGVGINETGVSPDASAILDVNSTNKGLLIPRVALISPTNPIVSPATSLLVYNTSTSGTYSTPGFYYFNGTDWVPLAASVTSNSRTVFRNLISSVSLTVNNSTAPSTTLLNFDYTPINDTILIQVNLAGRINSSTAPTTPGHPWLVRLVVNSVTIKQTYPFPPQNSSGNFISTSFTIPVAVTPNTINNIRLVLLSTFTSSGSITLGIDPSVVSQFANIIIHDVPTN